MNETKRRAASFIRGEVTALAGFRGNTARVIGEDDPAIHYITEAIDQLRLALRSLEESNE